MPAIPSLKERYRDYFDIGAAITPQLLQTKGDLIKTQFSSLTAENQMKPGPIHPAPDTWAFEDADAIAAFAREQDRKSVV